MGMLRTSGVVAVMLLSLAPRAGAQVRHRFAPDVGLIGQTDAQFHADARPTPIGLAAGFAFQRLLGLERLALGQQLSYFPISMSVSADLAVVDLAPGQSYVPPDARQALSISTTQLRLSVTDPGSDDVTHWFMGAGVATSLSTPRRAGHRTVPLLSLGAQLVPSSRRAAIEVSLQCGLRRLGRTACLVPMTVRWR